MKKKNLFSILFLILFLGNVQALENKIILKIDNEIITSIDLLNEIKYISTLNPSIKNLDKNRLKLIGKKSLIKEIIKKNEILKYIDETKIDQKYLKRLIKDRYLKLNFSTEADFLLYLKSNQVDIREIENKLTIEALWNQLIYSKFSSKLKINKKNLEEIIKNENKKTSKSFLLSEIFFNIKSKDELDSKYNEIKKAIENNSFESAAATYSVSDSSNVGGKLGWINEKSLSQNIKINLKKIKKNNFTRPIFVSNGYLILKVNDIRLIKNEFDEKIELEKSIEYETNRQLSQYSNIYFNKIKKNLIINEL